MLGGGPAAVRPGAISEGRPADSSVGDFEAAFATAPVKIEAIYTTPYQNQAPMEPHATMAVWEGQMLTVHTAAQLTTNHRKASHGHLTFTRRMSASLLAMSGAASATSCRSMLTRRS